MYLPKVRTYPLLLPFSWLYAMVVNIRNWMFDHGKLRQESFEGRVPVICVGNIAVGGTGKTPHTEYLVELFRREGIGPVAVLSRGYKRQSKGFVLAVPGINASKLGDESYQLYRKFPDVMVAVDADRPHGINKLLALPTPPAVVILDDAYQHRYVKPGLSICLTSYNRILYKDSMLPAGRLREPGSNVRRADIVIVTKCPPALRSEEETEITGNMPTTLTQPIYYSAYRYGRLVNMATGLPTEIPATSQVLIVAGIADPTVMENYVHTHFRLLDKLIFGDHHSFTPADISKIKQRLESVNVDGYCTNDSGLKPVIITTEKDAARLVDNPNLAEDVRNRIYYLPTEVYFLQKHEQAFDKAVLDYVRKNLKQPEVVADNNEQSSVE